ncbi:MAG: phosphoribosyl-ATP pyrophosphohydrolase [Cellulosilyticaceae bacterium]
MQSYNKLVRDGIPSVIEADGKTVEVEYVEGTRMGELLEEKLIEEFNEFLEDKNIEELADMLEVIFGMAQHLGYDEEQLLRVREEKFRRRGGFKEGIYLKNVIEE